MITIEVNGTSRQVDIEPDTPLLWVLRDVIGLTGTKFGCGIAQCGACTVHIDGSPMRSCSVPLGALDGTKITTIEGLSSNNGHPVQRAWIAEDVPQCGYCQSGHHGRRCIPETVSQSDRCRYRCQHHEHLSVRNL
jgi:aerobic-type carbon monoxide dehydrogenase small subunit (CoxS/CutS family)